MSVRESGIAWPQEEAQGVGRSVQGADGSVVVLKSRPMKAREGVEDKTEMTRSLIFGGGRWPKASAECEGGTFIGKM